MVPAAIINSELSTFTNTLEVIYLMCVYEKHVYDMSSKGLLSMSHAGSIFSTQTRQFNGADK